MIWIQKRMTQLVAVLVSASVLMIALFSYGKLKKNEGAKAARSEDKEADYEHAEAIRDRADRGLVDRMRALDDAGYRD